MRNNRKPLYLLSAALLMSLASCGGGNTPASKDSGSNTQPSTSDTSASSSKSSTITLNVTLENSTIPSGSNFFSGCKPSVILADSSTGEEEEVFDYTKKTTYSIIREDDQAEFGAGDPLPAGNYIAKIRHNAGKNYRAEANFTVTQATPTTVGFDESGNPLEGSGVTAIPLSDIQTKTYKDYLGMETFGIHGTPTLDKANLLVIPVQFTNISFPETVNQKGDTVKDVLQEAFFGESEDTPWESLHSYYEKASFGALNIGGTVTDIFTANFADTSITDKNDSSWVHTLIGDAVKWVEGKGTDGSGRTCEHPISRKDFDADKDGRLDGIELVYITSVAVDNDNASAFWNYTSDTKSAANLDNPCVSRWFWSRWDFLCNAYYNNSEEGITVVGADGSEKKVDAHTIIHETGHMMGAPDYYSYDHNEGPAGCVDMMDQNVGDHNALTKMSYGWVAPWVVDGSKDNFEITLPSYTETGKFLLIRNTNDRPWNGTPYDEYLMLEYYTPTGVNEEDSDGYPEWSGVSATGSNVYGHGGTYRKPGLQVFHVDERASSIRKDAAGNVIADGYTNTPRPNNGYSDANGSETAAQKVHDNTPSRSGDLLDPTSKQPNAELAIVTPSGISSFTGSSYHTSFGLMANVFGLDSYFMEDADDADKHYGGSFYSNYKMKDLYKKNYYFNDNSVFHWTFEVTAQTDDSITLHIIKTAF